MMHQSPSLIPTDTMATFLTRAGSSAAFTSSRSTRILQKRFRSHSHHSTGPEAPPTHEGFTSNGFKYALVTVVGLLAWSRVDEHLTKQGQEKHPITRYIEYYMRSEQESARLNDQHIALAQKAAEENKFNAGAILPPKVQLRYPDQLHNASGRNIELGTTVDTEDILPKYH